MIALIFAAAAAAPGLGASASAAGTSAPPSAVSQPLSVGVGLGPAVAARLRDLGPADVQNEQVLLAREVQSVLAPQGARSAHLVIVDIQPNRPTTAQLGASPALKADSLGIGGAAIEGQVTGADGRVRPVRFRFFQPNLNLVGDYATWGGAEIAFARLAVRLKHGEVPFDHAAWAAPRELEAPTGTLIRR